MKKLFYPLPSSRSFTRLLSILPFAVVAFATLELLAVQQALAGIACCKNSTGTSCVCDASLACPSTFPFNTGRTCFKTGTYGSLGTINSEIECTARSGSTTLDSTSLFSRTAILDCTVSGSADQLHDGEAVCQLDLSYSRPAGLTQCSSDPGNPTGNPPTPPTYKLTYAAYCDQVSGGNAQNRLSVTGTLKCGDPILNPNGLPAPCGGDPDCILRLGIAGQQGACSELFPAGSELVPPVADLAEGQVLSFSTTVELVDGGSSCTNPLPITGPVIGSSQEQLRYCNGNSFNNGPVDCTFGTGKTQEAATVLSTTDNAINFDVDFDPTVLNVTCNPNNNDFWHFTIFGNQHLDVTLIDVTSLTVEGAESTPVTCDPALNNNLSCDVKACPQVAQAVKDNSNTDDGTVDLTVTGSLLNSGTPPTLILGEQHVQTSGK